MRNVVPAATLILVLLYRPLPACLPGGGRGTILWSWLAVVMGILKGVVLPLSVDAPDDYALGYHVIQETKPVVTMRWDEEPA